MTDDAIPEADRTGDAPHPRDTHRLFGQEAAEAEFVQAMSSGKLHHAWLITGPPGVGKATLAWRIARFLLAGPPAEGGLLADAPAAVRTLDVPPDHPVTRRVSALSEPGLLLIRRAWDPDRKRLKTAITVDEVRRIGPFFGLSQVDGGRRVVIVDAADELNTAAANALLKVLEEPPERATLILVSHAPARLLPTIRSRCRALRALPLDAGSMAAALAQAGHPEATDPALAELAGGSVGEALRLVAHDGPALYARIVGLLDTCPRLDRTEARALADHAAARGAEARLDVAVRLLDLALARLARTGAGVPPATEAAPGESDVFARLAPGPAAARDWADLQQNLSARVSRGRAVNLDPASLLLDAFLRINEAAQRS